MEEVHLHHPEKGIVNCDSDIYDEPDASRPFFQRRDCEIGIYLSVYDAVPVDLKSVGLEHFFDMQTTDLLYQEFSNMDLVHIRASLDRRGLMKDSYVERFEPGIVLAIAFDHQEALDALWNFHVEGKLSPVLHDILITQGVLKAVTASRVKLEVRLWADEYESCKAEIEEHKGKHEEIRYKEKDMAMVKRLKEYQETLAKELSSMRDTEFQFDEKSADFVTSVKRLVPEEQTEISSLRYFDNLVKKGRGSLLHNMAPVEQYYGVLEKWRRVFRHLDLEVVTPLLQIHRRCELDAQRETKAKIITGIKTMQRSLRLDGNLLKVSHPEVAKKIPKWDGPLLLGLLSLVPLGVERVADTDILIDEYMRKFGFDENA